MAILFYTFWGILLIFICISFLSYNSIPKASINNTSYIVGIFIIIVAAFWIATTPFDDLSATDKRGYYEMFKEGKKEFRDIGLVFLIKIVRFFTLNHFIFFFVSALLYISFYYAFLRKSFKSNACIVLIASFLYVNYFLYGANTLRSGIAISFCMYAIAKNQKKFTSILFFIFAILMHKSVILITVMYLIAKKNNGHKIFLLFWCCMLALQLAGIFELGIIKFLLLNFNDDNNYSQYLGENTKGYNVGLRLDFIFYSAIPLIISYYYIKIKRYRDNYYSIILNTYIGINAIWMMFVRMPYTDRIAYLSWVLFPFIVLYPLLSTHTIKTIYKIHLTISMLLLGGFINFALTI